MKAKLIKKDGHYFLEVEPNTWTPPNRFHSIIANTLEKIKGDILQLSLKNCQAIECGYDLDELAKTIFLDKTFTTDEEHEIPIDGYPYQWGFKVGFQKALELIGDKKFSENDIHEAYFLGERDDRGGLHDILKSLQQTEWDVEIEMEFVGRGKHGIGSEVDHYMPKRDEDRCLILKRI